MEIAKALEMCGLELNRYYCYGNTVALARMNFWIR